MSTREETIERLREQAATEQEEELPLDETVEEDDPVEGSKRSATREYIVFVKTGSETWKERARVEASSAANAVSSLGELLEANGEYAACPSRNWSVGSPEIETITSVKIKFK